MSFDDLPPDWPTRAVDDPEIRDDVLDLFVGEADRAARCLTLLVCDDDRRLLQPLCITDLPRRTEPRERRDLLDFLSHLPGTAVLAALGRPTGDAAPAELRGWRADLASACARHGLTLLGVHLVTAGGVREVSGG